MARTNVIRLCLSLAAIPALFALCVLTIPQADAEAPAAPAPTASMSGSVLTSTNPISVSGLYAPEYDWTAEPVRDPTLAVGPDGTVHFAWWTEMNGFQGTCSPTGTQDAAFYAFIDPGTQKLVIKDAVLDFTHPRLSVGSDNTLFVAWLKCSLTTGQYHPAVDWVPSRSWLTWPQYGVEFPYAYAPSPFDTPDYDDEAPALFVAQEHGQSRPHLVWERYDPLQADSLHLLYYSRPITDSLPITVTRTPDPRLQTTTIPIADYTGQNPTLAVFDRRGNIEAHIIWESPITADCLLHEIDWGYAESLPPTLTTAEPGALPNPWQLVRAISTNAAAKRKAKAPVSGDMFTRTAQFPVTATTPDGGLYVVWNEWTFGSPDYQVMTSRLVRDDVAGPSWSPPVTVTTATRAMLVPAATAVDKRGRQYIMWNDGFDKILLQAASPGGDWKATAPIQLNRGPWCAGSASGSGDPVGKVNLVYDPDHEKLHATWLARTDTASSPNRLCYASIDLLPHKSFLPYIGQVTALRLGAPPVSGIKPIARP